MTMITHPDTSAAEPKALSIYEAIGGRAAIKAAVDGLFERLLADAELGRFFPAGVIDVHRRYVVTLLGEALGVLSAIGDQTSPRPIAAWASVTRISTAPPPTSTPLWTSSAFRAT